MDLLETTFKVIEKKILTKENVSAFKENLNQHEQYINHLKEILEEAQAINSENAGFLEINNLSKNAFNENFKESKSLCGQIYGYVQQIEENLENLSRRENSLNDLYTENNEHLKKLEAIFASILQIRNEEIMDISAGFLEEFNKTKEELDSVISARHDSEQLYENLAEQQQDKQNTSQSLKLEIELLEDKLENENEETEKIQEKNDFNKNISDVINRNTEIKDKVLLAEESLLNSLQNFKELMEQKNKVFQKQNESIEILKNLNEEFSALEFSLKDYEIKQRNILENFTSRIDEKNDLLKQNQNIFTANQEKIFHVKEEIEQLRLKLMVVDEKLASLQQIFETEDFKMQENNNLEQLDSEFEVLVESSKKMLNLTSENENKIKALREELAILKSPNPEVVELKDKLQALEKEFQNNAAEKEIEDIEMTNKNLQKNIEHYETTLKELTFQDLKLELDLKENEEKLSVLTVKCENKAKEILSLETAKQESAKLFPKPTSKRQETPPQKRTAVKRQETPPKKRAAMDFESDSSSVDGEKLSYAEFMAKKRRQKQRQKRADRSSDSLKHT